MASFTITINDAAKLAGITAARTARNDSLPQTIKQGEGGDAVDIPNPDLISTDAAYVQFVMDSAAESYKKQYNT